MTGEHSLTVDRAQLITLLQARRREVEEETLDRIEDIRHQIERGRSDQAWADWYQEMVDRLRAGTAIVQLQSGGNRVFFPTGSSPTPIPPTPDKIDVAQLEYSIEAEEDGLRTRKNQLDAALKLLEIATGETVEIPVAQYESLLR